MQTTFLQFMTAAVITAEPAQQDEIYRYFVCYNYDGRLVTIGKNEDEIAEYRGQRRYDIFGVTRKTYDTILGEITHYKEIYNEDCPLTPSPFPAAPEELNHRDKESVLYALLTNHKNEIITIQETQIGVPMGFEGDSKLA